MRSCELGFEAFGSIEAFMSFAISIIKSWMVHLEMHPTTTTSIHSFQQTTHIVFTLFAQLKTTPSLNHNQIRS
jgi:hypothetical protein